MIVLGSWGGGVLRTFMKRAFCAWVWTSYPISFVLIVFCCRNNHGTWPFCLFLLVQFSVGTLINDIPVTVDDQQRLIGHGWLTDAIQNAYMVLIRRMMGRLHGPWLLLSTYFFTDMRLGKRQKYDFSAPSRWCPGVDVLSHHNVLMPIHHDGHRSLAYIETDRSMGTLLNSLMPSPGFVGKTLHTWVRDLERSVGKLPSFWNLLLADCWQQNDRTEYGVFVCRALDRMVAGDRSEARVAPPETYRHPIMSQYCAA